MTDPLTPDTPAQEAVGGLSVTDVKTEAERLPQWPVGYYAPGSYWGKCLECGEQFTGDKRARQCPNCALQMLVRRIATLEAEPAPTYEDGRQAGLREALDAVRGQTDQRCAKCGHPKSNHPYRHPFVSTGAPDPASAILALTDAPAEQPDPVAEAARVLLKAVSQPDLRVVKPYYESTGSYIGKHAVDRFLRALAGEEG